MSAIKPHLLEAKHLACWLELHTLYQLADCSFSLKVLDRDIYAGKRGNVHLSSFLRQRGAVRWWRQTVPGIKPHSVIVRWR